MKNLIRKPFFMKLRRTLKLSLDFGIMPSSAELSYYLLFSVFPMLIAISSALALLRINIGDISFLEVIVPHAVLEFVSEYMERSFGSNSLWFLFLGTYLTLFSGSQYIASVRQKLRAISGTAEKTFVYERLTAIIYSVLVLFLFFITLVFSFAGREFLNFLAEYFRITEFASSIWLVVRFVIIGAVAFFATAGLFRSTFGKGERKPSDYLIGSITVMLLWVVCSWAFSFFIDSFADYSVIYGSLSTVIVLLLWLYLTNLVLLFGGVVNFVFKIDEKNETD